MESKTLILSNVNGLDGRGIITLYIEDDLLKCKLRLYDVAPLSPQTKLGVYHNNEVYKSNLLYKSGVYYSSLVGDFDLSGDFYVALVDTENENKPLLAGGTYAGYFSETDENETEEELPIEKVEHEPSTNVKSQNENQQNVQDVENVTPSNMQESIFSQFQYIYENYSKDEDLNSKIENGKFVKIKEGDENYSIGAIYDGDQIKYMCYAVKCKYNTPAPEELGEHYQWLPLDAEDPLSDGYYIVYQDATDLKIIEV